jgi:osmotically-inducible protein OsmY/sporulation protein YlmC with PRC-barrel domain
MTIKNTLTDIKLQQPVLNWQVTSTDRTPISVLPIAAGQNVILSDGYSGKITHLLADKEGRLEVFVIQTSGWSRRKVIIPIDRIEHIDGEDVYLSIAKYDLKRLPTYRPDDVLVAHVKHVLWADTILHRTDDRQIHVEVENGIAYLSGYVSFPSMSSGAERAALKVDGIWKVENDLTIDDDLRIAVALAIANDPRTKNARIFVGANNGFVTLTGQAPDLAGRAGVQAQAVSVPKVRGVINSIQVPGVEIRNGDQRPLQPVIGSGVYATDMPVGKVENVIINPDNRLVTGILVDAVVPEPTQTGSNWLWNEKHYSERKIVIPVSAVRHQTSVSVFLKEKAAFVAKLHAFDPTAYSSPPHNWEPPYPYKHADVLLARDESM